GLLGSLPRLGQHRKGVTASGEGSELTISTSLLKPIPGQVPSPRAMPPGCAFAPRCWLARPACDQEHPSLEIVSASQLSRCLFWRDVRLDESMPEERLPGGDATRPGPDHGLAGPTPLLEVQSLRKEYQQAGSLAILGQSGRTVKAVDNVSLTL